MKKINYLFISILLLSASIVSAQYGIGTNEPKATLDITSTTNGILIPRMTSTQRDAITSPANALLIFNTTNNSFEVFKTSCSCWVTVVDNGNTPASSLVNTAPSANNISISGQFLVGKTLKLNYTYFDGQLDPEGLTTIQWQVSGSSDGTNATNKAGATNAEYITVTENAGNFIRAVVTPRATSGVKNGVYAASSWILVDAATTSTANNLVLSGTPAQGSTLTSGYTFAGGSGTENSSSTGTEYIWQTASDALGKNLYNASLYSQSAFTKTYTPQSDLIGRFIRVAVKPKDSNGLQASNFVYSAWAGPITTAVETGPEVKAVSYSPSPSVGLTLTGSYSYYDVNNDPEGSSLFQWYLADNVNGLNQTPIAGATNSNLTVPVNAANKFVGFSVTPKALSGTLTGTTSPVYYNSSQVAPVANFTFTGSAHQQLPFFSANKMMNSQENEIKVEINVTSAGGLKISSNIVNGYSFSGNYTLSNGIQWISLSPSGTKTTFNSTGDSFTITGSGSTTETKTINIYNTKLGNQYITHYNGITGDVSTNNSLSTYTNGETFNNNGSCTSKPISTSSCGGSTLTIGSNSYDIVNINGQCWMKTNIKEIPSNFASLTTTSWTNGQDIGAWGYFNSTSNLSFATIEPASGHGYLYQWSAAMNGATIERAQGVCPTGWHVPSDCEWMYLEHGQGMAISQQITNNSIRASGASQGSPSTKLRSAVLDGTNSSGFSGLLTGRRQESGGFVSFGTNTGFFTSTPGGTIRELFPNNNGIWRSINEAYLLSRAYNVRCLKD